MARASIGWSRGKLAEVAGIGVATVVRFEAGSAVASDTITAIEGALTREGVAFVASGKFAGAVVPPKSV